MFTKKLVIFSTVAVGLAACGPLPLYYKAGEPVGQIDATLTQCRVESLEKVPVAERRRYVPPVFARRTFRGEDGKEYSRRVLVQPGGFEKIDANEELRADVTNQCMIANGFQQVSLPTCSSAVTRATVIRATQVLPALTPNSCVIRIRDGKFQVVTP